MNPQGTKSCSSLVHPVSLELPRLWVLLIDLTFQHLPEVRLEMAKNQLSNQQLLETCSKTAPNWKKNGTSWSTSIAQFLDAEMQQPQVFRSNPSISEANIQKTPSAFSHLRVSDFCGTSSGAKVQKVKSSSTGPISSGNASWQCYPMLRADPSELYMVH